MERAEKSTLMSFNGATKNSNYKHACVYSDICTQFTCNCKTSKLIWSFYLLFPSCNDHTAVRSWRRSLRLLCSPFFLVFLSNNLYFTQVNVITSLKTNLQITCIFAPLKFSQALKTRFSSGCTRLFGGGGGRGDKNIKSKKCLIFAIFVLVRGVYGGRASDWGGPNAPMPPCHHCLFFPEKHQTLHNLTSANCMHDKEMIIVDS